MVAQGATRASLLLDGSIMPGLQARALVASGSLHPRAAPIEGTVDLPAADGIRVGGDATLRVARFPGEARFIGARVSGDARTILCEKERPQRRGRRDRAPPWCAPRWRRRTRCCG